MYHELTLQENILLDAMFDVPGSDIVDVIVEEDSVKHGKPTRYVTRPTEETSETTEEGSSFESREYTAQNP